ncbi:MAG: hypothetical protein N3D75_03350 [Candidatus Aenigmarchaeota archaeon]|nr:hypothetical protein [Candidatus Aenigmarchaeota archaeon]
METGKILSTMILIVIPIAALLLFVIISNSTMTPKCFDEISGSRSEIKDYLTACASNCWSKNNYGRDPNSADCVSITIKPSEKLTNQEIESISKNFKVKSYLNFDLDENTFYRIKLRYDYGKQEVSVINEGYCGNNIIEGTEFCDNDASVCQEKFFGECTGGTICYKCVCSSEIRCDLCYAPTLSYPSTDVDWCKYCKYNFEISCSDGIDNDCDNSIDVDDSDCDIPSDEISPINKKCAQSIDYFLQKRVPRLYGIGDCIVYVHEKTNIPITVLVSIPIGEGGWNIDNRMQNGFCREELGNPPNKPSNNLYSIKGDGCFWRTFECYSYKKYDESCSQRSYNCCDAGSPECPNMYKCYIRTRFRAYDNKCDSINDFANLVLNSYQNAMKYTDDPKQFVRELQKGGYATSPVWVDNVIWIMDIVKNNLDC